MGSHVLVPFDGSKCAERGLERAIADHPDAAITVLSVVEPLSTTGTDLSDAPLDTGGEVCADGGDLGMVDRIAREREIDLRTVIAVGTPAATIVEYANEHVVETIVMGTHGRSGLSLGSCLGVSRRRSLDIHPRQSQSSNNITVNRSYSMPMQ